MSHVFISYSHDDQPYARALADDLLRRGFDVWIDDRIDFGDRWFQVIVKAIRACAAFLVIMTPEAEQSEWVEREILLAQREKKPLFPVLLRGQEFPLLITIQYADVTDGRLPPPGFYVRLEKYALRKRTPGDDVTEPRAEPEEAKLVYSPEVQRLLDRLNDPDTEPPERLQIGDRLAELGDPRPGVALTPDPSPSGRGEMIPDIDWVEIPAGEFIYQDRRRLSLPTFYIARYPITYVQFQAFVDAPDGFRNDEWWRGLAERETEPGGQTWSIANRPRENVSWYDAVAFCRWLNAKLPLALRERGPGGEGIIRLPTEQEWEKAARGVDRRGYPWGNGYRSGYANVNERKSGVGQYYLQQTTAVGVYPQGASPYGVLDMTGNLWEWGLNERDNPVETSIAGTAWRCLRGGSWLDDEINAMASHRNGYKPSFCQYDVGFRVVCASPISNR